MTKKKHETGSDRVSEISKKYNYQWVLNLQGDEPLINVNDVKNLIKRSLLLFKKQKFSVSTLYFKKRERNKFNPSEARLLINKNNEIIIFTRKKVTESSKEKIYLKHIGVFLYRKNFLEKFSNLKERFLERDQRLEQLRIIENGYRIVAFKAQTLTRGVDTYKDLCHVRKNFK
jgi:3-deoxy-manno-octulosonate cytidylyltransferase (CMP-KDO synthetase)